VDPFALGTAAGLGAALTFGVGDFLAQRVTRDVGWLRTMFWLQLAGVPFLLTIALAWTGIPHPTSAQLVSIAGFGVMNTLAAVGLYRAFEVGQLSVVSPIVSCFGAVAALLSVLVGDAPPAGLWPGLVALVLGIVLASATRGAREDARVRLQPVMGVGWAILSAVAFGTAFFGVSLVVDELGPAWPLIGFRCVTLPLLFVLARVQKQTLAPPQASARTAVAAAVFDTTGMFVYTVGTAFAHVAVVAVLSSLFSAVTVALAAIFLRERLFAWQWVGLVAIAFGIAWVVAV
jgi:drug/metabolite transporter (DMT)-like permease